MYKIIANIDITFLLLLFSADKVLKQKVKVCGSEFFAKVVNSIDEAKNIFIQEHGSPLGGHSGESKTILKIREHFFWPGMSEDIKNWVKNFIHCSVINK